MSTLCTFMCTHITQANASSTGTETPSCQLLSPVPQRGLNCSSKLSIFRKWDQTAHAYTHTPHMHTSLSTQGRTHISTICPLGAQGTHWSYVPFYPQHLAGTWKNLCREKLGEPASSSAALLSPFPSSPAPTPSSRKLPLLCCPQGSPTRPLCCLCALAAWGVFHLHLPHHSCLHRSPPTPCSPPGKELLETLSPIKVGAPDRTPIPHLPLV